jgi:phage shock protein A
MGIFSRMSDIINANINSMLDKAEDPEKIVRLMIQEMEDTLVEVRSAAARAIADKKEITRTRQSFDREIEEWESKAELAISKGRDDLAKAALAERKRVEKTRDAMDEEFAKVEEALERFNEDIASLQEKLADAKARQKSMIVRHQTASKRLQVRAQIHDHRMDDALLRFESFERKMDDMEGRIEAYDLGKKDDLKQQFDELTANEDMEQELADLKARMGQQDAG